MEVAGEEPLYVEYVSQMRDEVPFMLGGQKFEYVLAKYPNGKQDIGVYAFAGDVVYAYNAFRKIHNLQESKSDATDSKLKSAIKGFVRESFIRERFRKRLVEANWLSGVTQQPKIESYFVNPHNRSWRSKDPNADHDAGDVTYRVIKITADPAGDDYDETMVGEYDDKAVADRHCFQLNLAVKQQKHQSTPTDPPHDTRSSEIVPEVISENGSEPFSKMVSGTVQVDGTEYDYSALVSGNIVTTRQPHGEDYSEVDEDNLDIEIKLIIPDPVNYDRIHEAIFDDIHRMNMFDLVS